VIARDMDNCEMDSWEVDYLRKVLEQTGMSGNALAAAAGLSPSTINRPLNDPDYQGRVSPSTLDKVAKATNIPYRSPDRAGLSDASPAYRAPEPLRQGGIVVVIDGNLAELKAIVTLDTLAELRRKIDLIEQLLQS
jgi:transcriptional regulator with XRE-family HTH domain